MTAKSKKTSESTKTASTSSSSNKKEKPIQKHEETRMEEEEGGLADMTTTAVRGDSPAPEDPSEEDFDVLEKHERTGGLEPTQSTEDSPGRQYVVNLIDSEIGSHVREGDLRDPVNVLISGIAEMQDEVRGISSRVTRIASKQERTVEALLSVLSQIDKDQGRKPSSEIEKQTKKVTLNLPESGARSVSRGPSAETRLSNAGLLNSGDRGQEDSVTRSDSISQREFTREEAPHRESRKEKTPTSYGGSNPPSSYYISYTNGPSVESIGNVSGISGKIEPRSETDWIADIIRDKVEKDFPEFPSFKQLKLEHPEKYDGKDDPEVFDSWLSKLCRWMRLAGLTGPKLDSERVLVLGQMLTGQALIWYNSVVDNPNRVESDWTFIKAVIAMYTRFVHKSTVLTATEKYEAVRYTKNGGAAQLANDLTRYAQRMVEVPDGYTLRRRFWELLPEEITVNLGRARLMSAERTPLNELVRSSVMLEETLHREMIHRRMRAAKGGNPSGSSGGHNANGGGSSGNTGSGGNGPGSNGKTQFGRFKPRPSFTQNSKEVGDRKVGSTSTPSSGFQNSRSSASSTTKTQTPTAPSTGKGKSTGPTCYRCGGRHYVSEGLCPKGSGTTTPAVRHMVEVQEPESDIECKGQEDPEAGIDAPLEGSQYDGSEDEEPEELYDEYPEDENEWMGGMRVETESEDNVYEESEWLGGMRLFSLRDDDEREASTSRRRRATRPRTGDFLGVPVGIPQGDRPRRTVDFRGRETDESHVRCEREIRTLTNMMDELQRRNAGLRGRLTESEMENDTLTRHNAMWREQAGEANLDLMELSDAIEHGLDHTLLLQRLVEVNRRQRNRFAQRERMLSRIQYRDEDETSDDGSLPELVSWEGDRELPSVWDWEPEERGMEETRGPNEIPDNQEVEIPDVQERLLAMSAQRDREYRSAITPKEVRPEREFKCMTTYVELNGLQGLALLDSGSSVDCVSPEFARIAKLKVAPLAKPVGLQLGCVGSRSTINFGIRTDVTIAQQTEKVYLDVVNIDHYDLILGVPFLQQFGIALDFKDETIRVNERKIPSLQVVKVDPKARTRRAPTGTSAKYQWKEGSKSE